LSTDAFEALSLSVTQLFVSAELCPCSHRTTVSETQIFQWSDSDGSWTCVCVLLYEERMYLYSETWKGWNERWKLYCMESESRAVGSKLSERRRKTDKLQQ